MSNTFPDFEVIQSRAWLNSETGATASIYGAVPWGFGPQPSEWEMVFRGWTIRDNITNTIGCHRPPFENKADAEALAEKWNREAAARRARWENDNAS